MNGDYQEGIKKAKDLVPSYKQIWKGMFNMMLQDEKLGYDARIPGIAREGSQRPL